MRGDGLFSSADPAMEAFLARTGTDKAAESAFVARNFLIDEGVSTERVESYRRASAVADHATVAIWGQRHRAYLLGHVCLPGDGFGPPSPVDPHDDDACPETFRSAAATSPYAAVDERLDLIRVVDLAFVAAMASSPAAKVRALAQTVTGGTASSTERDELDAVLATWTRSIDLRPVFAGFWEDLHDIFGSDPASDPPGWADALRNRLGLVHHDAARGEIDILVFRYPVRLVPKLRGSGLRPIVPPTVLDGSHSDAFCPAPKGTPGHTVDLNADTELRARREVLHPAVTLDVKHVFRVGTIRTPTDRDVLPFARHEHLTQVRAASGRVDYAAATDGDLP